jgi:hypothetical protein
MSIGIGSPSEFNWIFTASRRPSNQLRPTPRLERHQQMSARRFPPPWCVEELGACFVVKDSAGQKLAYVYFEEEPGRRSGLRTLKHHACMLVRALSSTSFNCALHSTPPL